MRFLILFFALLTPLLSSGQHIPDNIIVASGDKLRKSPRKSLPAYVAHNKASGGMYALQSRLKRSFGFSQSPSLEYTLQYYDSRLHLVQTRPLELAYKGKRLKYEFMVQLNGVLYVFSSYFSEEKNKECLLAQAIDPLTLQQKDAVIVAEVENPAKNGYFLYELAEQGNKLLLTFTQEPGGMSTKHIDLFVLNEHLAMDWHKEKFLTKGGESFNVEQYLLDNRGDVYMLSTLFPDQRIGKRQGEPTYQYSLAVFRNNGKEFEEYGIRLKDKFITDLKIALNADRKIVGGGFYAAEGSFKLKGSYFFAFDEGLNKVVTKSVKEFDQGFMSPPPFPAKGGNEIRNQQQLRQYGFSLSDLLVREDGSALLLGEQYFISSSNSFSKRPKRAKSNFFYDFQDVVVININAAGEIEWAEKVNKQQHTVDDAGLYSSYVPFFDEDHLFLLFNTYPLTGRGRESENTNVPETKLVQLNRAGYVKEVQVPALLDSNMALIPASAIRREKQELFILMGDKKYISFVNISIKAQAVLSKL